MKDLKLNFGKHVDGGEYAYNTDINTIEYRWGEIHDTGAFEPLAEPVHKDDVAGLLNKYQSDLDTLYAVHKDDVVLVEKLETALKTACGIYHKYMHEDDEIEAMEQMQVILSAVEKWRTEVQPK